MTLMSYSLRVIGQSWEAFLDERDECIIDFIQKMIRYHPGDRASCSELLCHKYFFGSEEFEFSDNCGITLVDRQDFEFEDHPILSRSRLQRETMFEILQYHPEASKSLDIANNFVSSPTVGEHGEPAPIFAEDTPYANPPEDPGVEMNVSSQSYCSAEAGFRESLNEYSSDKPDDPSGLRSAASPIEITKRRISSQLTTDLLNTP